MVLLSKSPSNSLKVFVFNIKLFFKINDNFTGISSIYAEFVPYIVINDFSILFKLLFIIYIALPNYA